MQNTDYKCPYCVKKFLNWKSVQGHLNRCKLNTNEYRICSFYGPIHINNINQYCSTTEFRKKYPNTTFDSQFWKRLRNSGKTDLRKRVEWDKKSIIHAIKSFYISSNRIPQSREFVGNLPSATTVQRLFGSWNNAIEEAGYKADYNSYGTKTLAKDSIWYMSKAEAYFVDNYLYNKYTYDYEPKYTNNKWCYDFYIKELDLYIEIAGGLDSNRIKEKISFNEQNNIRCKVIDINELYASNLSLVG